MTTRTANRRASGERTVKDQTLTRRLLAAGLLAGPVFLTTALLQAATRDGFDLARHPVSLLSTGGHGWIQIANFVVTGVLVLLFAAGLRRALHPGRAGTWGPLLVAAFGLGLIGGGVFVTDPSMGFPPGAPPGEPPTSSWHSLAHDISAGIALDMMILAVLVLSRRLFAAGTRGGAWLCIAAGVSALIVSWWPDRGSISVRLLVAVAILFAATAGIARWARGEAERPGGGTAAPGAPSPGTVSSRDGSVISYEASGSGPLIVLVAGALADRTDARKLAAQLSTSFTVVNYDRRGRGASTAARPYYEGCEVHDIESLLAAMGGRGFLFGSSSGGVLALDAAAALPHVDGAVIYEPPFIVSDGPAPDPSRFVPAITDAVGAGRLDDAARLFFTKSMGIPALGVLLMRHLMPSWKKMAAMAPTLLHDFAILNGTQDRRPLPAARWDSLTAPLLVLVGGKSEAFFHEGAKALTEQLPGARYSSLDGRNHSAVMTAPTAIAAEIRRFLLPA